MADDMNLIGGDTVFFEAYAYLEERLLLLGMSRSTKKGISMWCNAEEPSKVCTDYFAKKNLTPVVGQAIKMLCGVISGVFDRIIFAWPTHGEESGGNENAWQWRYAWSVCFSYVAWEYGPEDELPVPNRPTIDLWTSNG